MLHYILISPIIWYICQNILGPSILLRVTSLNFLLCFPLRNLSISYAFASYINGPYFDLQ